MVHQRYRFSTCHDNGNMHTRSPTLSDETIQWILLAKQKNKPRPDWKGIAQKFVAAKTYWAKWNQLEVVDGVLCRRWESDDGKTIIRKQIIIPEKSNHKHGKDAMRDVHDGPLGAHLRLRKTFATSVLLVWHDYRCTFFYKNV